MTFLIYLWIDSKKKFQTLNHPIFTFKIPFSSISKVTFDKLVADTAEVKANQLEIKAKLDLALQFDKKVDLLL